MDKTEVLIFSISLAVSLIAGYSFCLILFIEKLYHKS
jgi:hypothetical protein